MKRDKASKKKSKSNPEKSTTDAFKNLQDYRPATIPQPTTKGKNKYQSSTLDLSSKELTTVPEDVFLYTQLQHLSLFQNKLTNDENENESTTIKSIKVKQ